MKPSIAACLAFLLVAAAPGHLDAQAASRAFGFTLTHSLGASSSAHPAPCTSACVRDDALAPLSVSTLEIELAVPFKTRQRGGFEYHARMVPFAMVRNNPTEAATLGQVGWSIPANSRRASTVGIGIKPVGLRGWIGAGPGRLEVDVSAGILLFGSPLFAANAARFNFVYEGGVGLRLTPRGAVIGYRRHHVSNAGFADVNPGLNSHVLFVGLPLR